MHIGPWTWALQVWLNPSLFTARSHKKGANEDKSIDSGWDTCVNRLDQKDFHSSSLWGRSLRWSSHERPSTRKTSAAARGMCCVYLVTLLILHGPFCKSFFFFIPSIIQPVARRDHRSRRVRWFVSFYVGQVSQRQTLSSSVLLDLEWYLVWHEGGDGSSNFMIGLCFPFWPQQHKQESVKQGEIKISGENLNQRAKYPVNLSIA